MLVKWNQSMETANWLFYALMRVLIPGGVVLHFFGIPYGGAMLAFTITAVFFAYRRRKTIVPLETACWLIVIAAILLLQFDFQSSWQWILVLIYGLWIINQQQLQAYLIPGAFGKSFGISMALIAFAVTATPLVGWQETANFLGWSLPVFLFSAMLLMVRVNLMMAYQKKDSHKIDREKNLMFFNSVSLLFFLVGGFFLFSAWLPPSWTSGITNALGHIIQWILYPLALVLAKGSQLLKQLILLINPQRASQEPASGGLPEGNADLGSREAVVPFMEWAGWILLAGILVIAVIVTMRRKGIRSIEQKESTQVEEKSFMRLDEIFQRKRKAPLVQVSRQKNVLSNYRQLFILWLEELKKRGLAIEPAMTPNQIGREADRLGLGNKANKEVIDSYNRIRYREDQPTTLDEKRLENLVRDLEENQNFQ